MPLRLPVFAYCCLLALPALLCAQTNNSYPMLMCVKPAAAVIGQTTEHEVSARYSLNGATRVIVSGAGVTGEVVVPDEQAEEAVKKSGKKRNASLINVKFMVAPDAIPGVRDFRLVTPQGVSTVGQLVIARDDLVVDSGDNNTSAQAQPIGVPATICGAIEKAEDIDCYKFKADAGQSLVFHVRSQRLMNRLHDMQSRVDPLITLKTAAGMTLAGSDNYYAGDPLLAYAFEQSGEYVLEVRDVRYQGAVDWTYAIEINSRPFVTQVYPQAIRAGVETKLSLVGFNLPQEAFASINLPADSPPGLRWISPPVGKSDVNEFAVFVTPLPIADESVSENNTTATAQTVSAPCVINGRIESPSDQDCYTFTARKGETLTFEVFARRGWSGLDPTLRILNDKGAPIAEADDMSWHRVNSADSLLENWTAPADGAYTIEIRDLHQRGGPQYTYAIQVTRSELHFLLEVDTDKSLLAPGTNAVFYVRVFRKNGFSGEVQLAVDGLPAGVTAVCGRILPGAPDGCVILQAAPDAAPGAANIRVTGTATHPVPNGDPLQLSAVAQPLQEYYLPGGGRGNFPVEMHTVSVAAPMDIRSMRVSATSLELKPGESRKIDVTIERAPEFKGNVTLDLLFQHLEQPFGNSLPKGVTVDGAQSKTLLGGDESTGYITLKAAPDAPPVEKQLVPVMAHVSINFVMKLTFAGEPLFVSVSKPH